MAIYIVDIRKRRYYLERITVDAFTDLARRYRLSDDTTVTHLRGMPRYYCLRQGVIWIWPVPEWAWTGAVEKPT